MQHQQDRKPWFDSVAVQTSADWVGKPAGGFLNTVNKERVIITASPFTRTNSRSAGRHAVPLRFAGLRFLQQWAIGPLAHSELEHLPAPSANTSGRLRVHTGFRAGAPVSPVGRLAVLWEDTGLDGLRQVPQRAQAGWRQRHVSAHVCTIRGASVLEQVPGKEATDTYHTWEHSRFPGCAIT